MSIISLQRAMHHLFCMWLIWLELLKCVEFRSFSLRFCRGTGAHVHPYLDAQALEFLCSASRCFQSVFQIARASPQLSTAIREGARHDCEQLQKLSWEQDVSKARKPLESTLAFAPPYPGFTDKDTSRESREGRRISSMLGAISTNPIFQT